LIYYICFLKTCIKSCIKFFISKFKNKFMKKEKVGVKVVPDNRRKKDEERFPLKLRITNKGRRAFYGVGYHGSVYKMMRPGKSVKLLTALKRKEH
jgi:hypothetical protein